MSVTYGFFNSVNGDRTYNADDISNYFLKLISNGVFATPANAMQVQAASGMTVNVTAGWGFINCKWINNDGLYSLTLDAPDIVLNRIDRVVLHLDPTTPVRSISIQIKKGAAAASPVPPALTQTAGGVWELSLAQIAVNAGATAITQADITDERPDTSVCGFVTGLIDQIDTTNLFAQYDAAFKDWFTTVKQTLATTTLVRQYTSVYTTAAPTETIIPINISQYNYTLDVLNVYINGLRLTPGVDFTENGSANTITLANALDVVGTPVEFEVLKSVDGSEAESVVDMVYQLQTELGKIDANNYYCNGVNDNTALQEWLEGLDLTRQRAVINVIGTFGVDTTQYNVDGTGYSFVYQNASAHGLTLDFSQCYPINARGNNFAYFKNIKVEGLTIIYDDVANGQATAAITAENCTLENCDIYGTLTGTATVTAYSVDNCRLIECDSDLTGYGVITGISAQSTIINCCNIQVTSEGANTSAYGVQISDNSRADNSTFQATAAATTTSASASGGMGGGYYSNCVFIGIGGAKGQGFYISANQLLNVNNCIFRGYAKTPGSSGWGYGITGAASDGITVFLTGINCNSVTVSGYSQTGSMQLGQGHGSYMGCFYTTPSTPSTIVSYGRVVRNRV